jgi:hypothetical protein
VSEGDVDYVYDTDYVTFGDDGPSALHEGSGHTLHEAHPAPRPAPPATPRSPAVALPPPRRTKRLNLRKNDDKESHA